MVTKTINDVEFTNADFMVTRITDTLKRFQSDANAFDVADSIHNVYQFTLDAGAAHIAIQLAKLGDITATRAIHVYNLFVLKHKANVEAVTNWEFED